MNTIIDKVKALFNKKTVVLDVLEADIKALTAKCNELQDALDVTCREIIILKRESDPWWKALDEEMGRKEAEEAEYSIDVPFDDGPLDVTRQKSHWDNIHIAKEYEDDR